METFHWLKANFIIWINQSEKFFLYTGSSFLELMAINIALKWETKDKMFCFSHLFFFCIFKRCYFSVLVILYFYQYANRICENCFLCITLYLIYIIHICIYFVVECFILTKKLLLFLHCICSMLFVGFVNKCLYFISFF